MGAGVAWESGHQIKQQRVDAGRFPDQRRIRNGVGRADRAWGRGAVVDLDRTPDVVDFPAPFCFEYLT